MFNRLSFLLLLSVSWFSCTVQPDLPKDVEEAYGALPEKVDYNQHVKPILSDRCFSCHGPDKGNLSAGLRLDLPEMAYAELPETPGKKAIVPGKLSKSEVFHRIISNDPNYVMPAPESHLTLTAKEKAIIIKWIEDGAEYKPHWAFIKPEMPKVPKVKDKEKVVTPIDHFILNRLEQNKLTFSPEASKEILLRRLSLDLTGLPPTLSEIESFIKDKAPDAYEKQVDRLLASPHYGEKMAVDWLDAARFADSHGYTVDRIRDMSPWRDWVINAFNKNLHYNDFITWQLAGDLLPNPTKEQLIATAFNRNHQQNMEGGIVEEEFRVEYVSDRVNTMGDAIMALTVGCAKCHDHKFDPISQKEYYSLFSYFNNVKESGQISWDNAMPVPTMLLPDAEKQKIIAHIKNTEKQKLSELKKLQSNASQQLTQWIANEGYRQLGALPKEDGLIAHYPLNNDIRNRVGGAVAEMRREGGATDKPVFVKDGNTNVIEFEGDVWLNTKTVGKFGRFDAFTIGMWTYIPKAVTEGVIFHQSDMGLLYNFRGLHLNIKNNKFELMMAHTAPYNAITKYSKQVVPHDGWVHLMVTYNGSGKAKGYQLYLNGQLVPMIVEQDNLYKDILYTRVPGIELGKNFQQPALQFGAWERGKGLAKGRMKDIKVYSRSLTSLEVLQLVQPLKVNALVNKKPEQLSNEDRQLLQEYFMVHVVNGPQQLLEEIRNIKKQYSLSLDSIPELMIMQEMEQPRKAFVLDRGQYDVHKEEVQPGIVEALLPMPKDYPKNRLGLAKWLIHPDHPLTARVAVNRYWQMLFGKGLVKTSEDFGNQGELPSHPELLDWLAVTFQKNNWDVKALVKMMVMSATYRQSSQAGDKLMAVDPENILLGRGPSERLTAEMLRDQALAASGLLYDAIGGPSVYPYQPDGLWRINGATYVQDTGKNLYRRSLYTIWKRSVPNPTQATFDVGIRTSCIVRRQKTNTPLQALIMLNDPTFVEAAKVLGEQMTRASDKRKAVADVFVKLTGRNPNRQELELLMGLAVKQLQKFNDSPAKAKGWLQAGAYQPDTQLPAADVAAYAVVASTIINSDAAITKR